jgi:hypothetical protein
LMFKVMSLDADRAMISLLPKCAVHAADVRARGIAPAGLFRRCLLW